MPTAVVPRPIVIRVFMAVGACAWASVAVLPIAGVPYVEDPQLGRHRPPSTARAGECVELDDSAHVNQQRLNQMVEQQARATTRLEILVHHQPGIEIELECIR
jgi:hypothetical protein